MLVFFFFQAEDGIRDRDVTGVQTCALPISGPRAYGEQRQHREQNQDQRADSELAWQGWMPELEDILLLLLVLHTTMTSPPVASVEKAEVPTPAGARIASIAASSASSSLLVA